MQKALGRMQNAAAAYSWMASAGMCVCVYWVAEIVGAPSKERFWCEDAAN